jgi:hypothetical protein
MRLGRWRRSSGSRLMAQDAGLCGAALTGLTRTDRPAKPTAAAVRADDRDRTGDSFIFARDRGIAVAHD